jgi:O-succinylbenzoic acid--CoA ligase
LAIAKQLHQELKDWQQQCPSDLPPIIFLAESNPLQFLAGAIAASAADCSLVLCQPNWTEAEWQQVVQHIQPDICWGTVPPLSCLPGSIPRPVAFPQPLILVPTGGSSGHIRFAMHTWDTLMASVRGFQRYFDVAQINSFCVLPLHHVSGLMQVLRSFTSGGKLVVLPFKAIATGNCWDIDPTQFFLSLVPTQLQRLLNPADPSLAPYLSLWLAHFQTILLGGAPAWDDLLAQARSHRLRLAPTYGMTETASQIATLKPSDFLQGKTGCGQVLPHAQVTIHGTTGESLDPYQPGRITIQAQSLALGYYPNLFESQVFQPDDLGFLDAQGYLHISGRQSDKIITGGENVFPVEVEAAIRATGLVADVCVIGVRDRHWGEAIAAIYVSAQAELDGSALDKALMHRVSRFKHPKHWIAVDSIPRNAQGKINREHLKTLVEKEIYSNF